MGRSGFRRKTDRVFTVDLVVHQLDSIPTIHRLLHVHWRARRATPSEGRTPSQSVEPGNVIRWNTPISFTLTIPADPSDATILQPSPLTLQLRSERRARFIGVTFQNEGLVEVDLSDVAAVGYVAKNHLVQDSLLNTTLKLSIRVTHQAGDRIFRTRTLAAPSVSSAHDTIETPDEDSTGTLPPIPRDLNSIPQLTDPRLERCASAPYDRVGSGVGRLPTGPGRTSGSNAFVSASLLNMSKDADNGANAFLSDESPSTVLENSIPNPDLVQSRVYENMFQERLRDEWPGHIVASRVDATDAVNAVYAAVCATDGIGVAGVSVTEAVNKSVPQLPESDKTMSVEVLIESRNGAPPKSGTNAQPRLQRKTTGRSPGLSVKSSSMGDLTQLEKLTT